MIIIIIIIIITVHNKNINILFQFFIKVCDGVATAAIKFPSG